MTYNNDPFVTYVTTSRALQIVDLLWEARPTVAKAILASVIEQVQRSERRGVYENGILVPVNDDHHGAELSG